MKKQTGAALIVSLVILLIMTMIGLAAMRTSSMAEKMAANTMDVEIAFQATEIALRDAESWVAALTAEPDPNDTGSNNIWTADAMDPDLNNPESWWHERNAAWWTANGIAHATNITFDTNGGTKTITTPRYIIEYQQFVTDDLVVGTGGGPSTGRVYYRITARGTGGSDQSRVLLQSTMAKRY
jgi:type IV pilus assembly protein PilX